MKGLSLWQPWATAMELGLKRNETRSWPTSYRGELLICSTASFNADARAATEDDDLRELLATGRHGDLDLEVKYASVPMPDDRGTLMLPLGAALCIVDLVDCVRTETIADKISPTEREFGDYYPGRWAWITRNLKRFRVPRPGRGAQGLFQIEEKRAAELRAAAIPTCIHCGCTDYAACEGGCAWALPNECSRCVTVHEGGPA